MSSMMDDINKYAKIWDDAQGQGIFKDSPKPVQHRDPDDEDSFFGADFFGQNRTGEYDIDAPLNEVDSKYWRQVSRMADPNGKYDPLSEESTPEPKKVKDVADKMSNGYNPVYPTSIGKDQEPVVTQNWGVGGKEHFQLEELKVRLEKLESKLNAIESKGDSGDNAQSKIDNLKKQIDDLSNSLNGDRFSND